MTHEVTILDDLPDYYNPSTPTPPSSLGQRCEPGPQGEHFCDEEAGRHCNLEFVLSSEGEEDDDDDVVVDEEKTRVFCGVCKFIQAECTCHIPRQPPPKSNPDPATLQRFHDDYYHPFRTKRKADPSIARVDDEPVPAHIKRTKSEAVCVNCTAEDVVLFKKMCVGCISAMTKETKASGVCACCKFSGCYLADESGVCLLDKEGVCRCCDEGGCDCIEEEDARRGQAVVD